MSSVTERFTIKASDFEIVIQKHGEHDQSSHGNWADGASNPDYPFDTTLTAKDGTKVSVVTEKKTHLSGETSFEGILTVNGEKVGEWERRVGPDYVECTGLVIGDWDAREKSPLANKGIGTEFHKHTEEIARNLGKENLIVHAVSDGSAVWATEKFGFRFDPEKSEPVFTKATGLFKPQISYGKETWVHPFMENPKNREKANAVLESFKKHPSEWATPAEVLALGQGGPKIKRPASYKTGVWQDYTFGEYLLQSGWYGVKSSDHVTKMAGMIKLRIVGVEEVAKHGTHDQKTHGSWATGGMGAGVADSILARVRENGGLSVNMVDGSEPTSGYMVAKGAKFGSILDADDFYDPIKGPKALAAYMKKHKSELGGGKNYLGLWHNTEDGKVYLDVSENIQDKERAISAGRNQDQISIWDVANFAEIQTGGTGNVEKTGISRTSQEHLRNERLGDRGLRPEDLGQVSKAFKVIRFAPGLIPALKHLQGQHDQASHGSWSDARFDEVDDIRLSQQKGELPTIKELKDWMSSDIKTTPDNIKNLVSGMYNFEFTGTNRETGEPVKLKAVISTLEVSVTDEGHNSLDIDGNIFTDDGSFVMPVGEFSRSIVLEGDELQLWNNYLQIDTENTGTGFGTAFLNNAENYAYVMGVKNQYVHAVRMDGAANSGPFVWAKRGYGWNTEDTVARVSSHDNVGFHINRVLATGNVDVYTEETLYDIQGRWNTLSDRNPDYPTPHEIAYAGWVPGAKTWAGLEIMGDADWHGVKPVGPSNERTK